jgi:hypothetical protein
VTGTPHNDETAIAVFDLEMAHIGYLSREIAENLSPWIDDVEHPAELKIIVEEVTGGGQVKKNKGLNISIEIGNVDYAQYYDLSSLYGDTP